MVDAPEPRLQRPLRYKRAPVFDFFVFLMAALFLFAAMGPLLHVFEWTDVMHN